MLYLEMANRNWAIRLDGLYMNLGEEGLTPVTERQVEVDLKQVAIQATGLWRATSGVEIGIGGRLNSIKTGLKVQPGQVLPGRDDSGTNTWFDPLTVAREAEQRYASPYHLAYVYTGLGEDGRAMDCLE
jgi:hypothetical protein